MLISQQGRAFAGAYYRKTDGGEMHKYAEVGLVVHKMCPRCTMGGPGGLSGVCEPIGPIGGRMYLTATNH